MCVRDEGVTVDMMFAIANSNEKELMIVVCKRNYASASELDANSQAHRSQLSESAAAGGSGISGSKERTPRVSQFGISAAANALIESLQMALRRTLSLSVSNAEAEAHAVDVESGDEVSGDATKDVTKDASAEATGARTRSNYCRSALLCYVLSELPNTFRGPDTRQDGTSLQRYSVEAVGTPVLLDYGNSSSSSTSWSPSGALS